MTYAISENNTLLPCIFDYFSQRLEFKFSIVCTISESAKERDSKIPTAILATQQLEELKINLCYWPFADATVLWYC
jgi:hypothetical protein